MKFARSVVLSGGGTRCITFAGSLLYLRGKGALTTVRRWYGCSAGAFVAILFAFQASDKLIKQFVMELDFEESRGFTTDDIFTLDTRLGLDPGISLKRMIARLLESIREGSSKWSLADFKKETGHEVNYFISNVSKSTPFFANSQNFPNLFILDALYSTMAVPLYYQPYKYQPTGEIWCDGMLGANFPWLFLTEKERETAIGIFFARNEMPTHPSLFFYMNFILAFRNNYEQNHILEKWRYNCVSITTVSQFPSLQLDLTRDDREYLIHSGKTAMKDWWLLTGKSTFATLAWLSTSTVRSGILESQPQIAHPHTRSHSLQGLSRRLSETQKSLPDLYKDSHPSPDLSSQSVQSSRRWSV